MQDTLLPLINTTNTGLYGLGANPLALTNTTNTGLYGLGANPLALINTTNTGLYGLGANPLALINTTNTGLYGLGTNPLALVNIKAHNCVLRDQPRKKNRGVLQSYKASLWYSVSPGKTERETKAPLCGLWQVLHHSY